MQKTKDFLYFSLTITVGLIIYSLLLIIFYKLFFSESSSDNNESNKSENLEDLDDLEDLEDLEEENKN